ncbi:MAG: hypothetical protein K1X78_28095 [Verrucomicrobiaceae bacterium]|nr:hypothetical protein [Verrucomicrobiaceae bacterium]
MAKRRHGSHDEILMVPFLDILCSLIGVLVLIIVFLCVSQASQTEGRTQEEIDRAIEYKKLNRQQVEDEKIQEEAKVRLEKLARLKKELEEQEQKLARFRKLLSTSEDVKKLNEKMSQDALKELDNLMLEIEGYLKQSDELKKEIAALQKEIDKRKPPATPPLPPVVVQPGGSGLAAGSKAFFVEASSGKIMIYWDTEKKTQVSSAAAVIIADKSYDHFLRQARAVANSKLIFLVRDDGNASYNNAAGWAQQTHGFAPAQVAKLPIPGRGEIDLQMFKAFLGTIAPPADATLVPVKPKA